MNHNPGFVISDESRLVMDSSKVHELYRLLHSLAVDKIDSFDPGLDKDANFLGQERELPGFVISSRLCGSQSRLCDF